MLGRGRATALAAAILTGCTLVAPLDRLSGRTPHDGGADTASVDSGSDGFVDDTTLDVGDEVAEVAPPSDGPADEEAEVDVGACGTTCTDLPLGFAVVAFGAGASGTVCPTGFGQGTDTVEGPSVGAGACTCGCSIPTPPACPTNGAITNGYDTDGSGTCTSTGNTYANNGCGTEGQAMAFGPNDHHRFTPPGPDGGSCSAPVTQDDTKLTFALHGRVCQPTGAPTQCGGKVCLPPVDPPFVACLAAAGDVPCPTSFPNKHLVGTSASFTCSQGCTCSIVATCDGMLNYYTSIDCSGPIAFQIQANGQCVATNFGAYASHQYVPAANANATCFAGGSTSASTPLLGATLSVCCS
jgi:hypothetical protein